MNMRGKETTFNARNVTYIQCMQSKIIYVWTQSAHPIEPKFPSKNHQIFSLKAPNMISSKAATKIRIKICFKIKWDIKI